MSKTKVLKALLCAKVLIPSRLAVKGIANVPAPVFNFSLFLSFIVVFLFPLRVFAQILSAHVDFSANANQSSSFYRNLYKGTGESRSFTFFDEIERNANLSGRFERRYEDKKDGGSAKSEAPNTHPVAKLCSWKLTLPADASSIMVDGSCSYDPDGTIVSYHWTFSGSTPDGGKVRIEGPDSDKTIISGLENGYHYVLYLTVTDNEGATGIAWFNIDVGGTVSNDPLKSSVDFSDSAYQLSNYFLETGEPWSLNISDSLNNDPSGRFELRYGDKIKGKSSRSQILFNSITSEEVWTGFNIYLPKSWAPDFTAPESIFAYHTWSNSGGSRNLNPPVAIIIKGRKLISEIRYSHVENPTNLNDIEIRDTIGAPIIGEWVSYVIHAKFDQINGFVEIWQNGNKVIAYAGPVSYKHTRPPVPAYGVYKWYWAETGPSDVNKRVLYIDDIKIADGGGTYSLVAPPQKKK